LQALGAPFFVDELAGVPRPPAGVLARVVELGSVSVGTTRAPVIGVFLDSSDYRLLSLGVAGLQGQMSGAQLRWLDQAVDQLPKQSYLVLFAHHPIGDMAVMTRRHLRHLARRLGPRLLAFVTAHTHIAAMGRPFDHDPPTWEFTVGSVTDPPQEAAVLEIGHGADRMPYARLRTIPAIARTRQVCAQDQLEHSISAEQCRNAIACLRQDAHCHDLFAGPSKPPVAGLLAPSCQPESGGLSWWQALRNGDAHVKHPAEVKCIQYERTQWLLQCLGGSDENHRSSLDDQNLYSEVEAYREAPTPADIDRHVVLTCLSWAASVLQNYKWQGWRLAEAMDLGFDSAATFGARVFDPRYVSSGGDGQPVASSTAAESSTPYGVTGQCPSLQPSSLPEANQPKGQEEH
jgi:hypothetical protein